MTTGVAERTFRRFGTSGNMLYGFCERCMVTSFFSKKVEMDSDEGRTGGYTCIGGCGEEVIGNETSGFVSGRQVKGELIQLAREGKLR